MPGSILPVDDHDSFRSFAVDLVRAAGHDRGYDAATVAGAPRVVLISADADAADDAAAQRVGAIGFVAEEELDGARLRRLPGG